MKATTGTGRFRLVIRALLLGAVGLALLGLALVPRCGDRRLEQADLKTLRRLARDHPDDAEVFLALGERLRQSGQLYPAAVMTSRAYDLSGGEPRFAAAKAGGMIDRGDVQAAAELVQTALTQWPKSGELRAQLSRAYATRGYFTDALREAETAVRLSPASAGGWRALGYACSMNKRPDAAFAAFERAEQIEPRDAGLLADYGEALAKYGRAEDADRVLIHAAALAPQSARPAALLGRLRAERARTAADRAEARRWLEQALARAPTATDILYPLGLLELHDGRPAAAIPKLQRVLALDRTYGEAHLALGQAHQRNGQKALAEREFAAWREFSDYRRQATHLALRLRRAPDNGEILARLARLHAEHGDKKQAAHFRQRLEAVRRGQRSQAGRQPTKDEDVSQ